jgi:hypothetical protein
MGLRSTPVAHVIRKVREINRAARLIRATQEAGNPFSPIENRGFRSQTGSPRWPLSLAAVGIAARCSFLPSSITPNTPAPHPNASNEGKLITTVPGIALTRSTDWYAGKRSEVAQPE